MGLKINVGDIAGQSTNVGSVVAQTSAAIDSLISSIGTYGSNGGLTGAAWEGNKKFFQESHVQVLLLIKAANEELKNACSQFQSGAGSEDLCEDDLIAERDMYQAAVADWDGYIGELFDIICSADSLMDVSGIVDNYNGAKDAWNENKSYLNEAEKKLQELYDKNAGTADSFSFANDLQTSITGVISDLTNAWHNKGGFTDVTKGKWFKRLNNQIYYAEEIKANIVSIDANGNIVYDADKLIEQIKAENPNLSSSDLAKIEQFIKKNPQQADQSADDYLKHIQKGLLEVPGMTVEAGKIFLEKLASVYAGQSAWLSENAASILNYTGDTAQYVDDLAKAASVAQTGRQFASAARVLPIVGTALDFGTQIVAGEDVVDAGIKTAAHVGITAGVGIAATVILGVTPIGWVAVGVAGIGYFLGKGFDYLYDNYKDDVVDFAKSAAEKAGEVIDSVGDAVSGFFSGVASVFD